MFRSSKTRLGALAFAALAACQLAHAAPTYHLVDLGLYTLAGGVSKSGEIAGTIYVDDYGQHAAKYQGGKWKLLPDKGHQSYSVAINTTGELAGYAYDHEEESYPMFWHKDRKKVVIPMPGGQVYGASEALAADGTVVGTFTSGLEARCFSWREGQPSVDIGSLGGGECFAHAVNKHDSIAGQSTAVPGGLTHAFIYALGVMHDFGALPSGNFSRFNGLNDNGHAAGESDLADDTRRAIFYAGGVLQNLGTLGGTYSSATALNNHDDVVGTASDANNDVHGFLYHDGQMISFDTLIDNAAGWDFQFSGPTAINDDGVIVGTASYLNSGHSFMLVPIAPIAPIAP